MRRLIDKIVIVHHQCVSALARYRWEVQGCPAGRSFVPSATRWRRRRAFHIACGYQDQIAYD